MSFLFGVALAKRPSENSDPLHGLVERLAFIAGIEHLTAFLAAATRPGTIQPDRRRPRGRRTTTQSGRLP
jgi:predicted metal-dependent hydrolase